MMKSYSCITDSAVLFNKEYIFDINLDWIAARMAEIKNYSIIKMGSFFKNLFFFFLYFAKCCTLSGPKRKPKTRVK